MTEKELKIIKKYQKEVRLLSQAAALLDWDQKTYMPKNGMNSRAEELALLSSMIHEKFTAEEFFSAVKNLKDKNLDEENKIITNKLYKEISKSRKLPKEFVEELSRVTSLADLAWQEAREKADFSIFQPHLDKIVKLKIKQAKLINLSGHIYNSLIDDYEEGMTYEKLQPIFQKLKPELVKLLKKIESSKSYSEKVEILKGDENKQLELCTDIARKIGLKEENSRIDKSMHPFSTTLGFQDSRITTNIREDLMFSFGSTMHESGHALYELGIPEKFKENILGNAPSMGLHESQSRFWENMIGLNKPFWRYYFKRFKEAYGINNFEKFYKDINAIFPGMIRIEGDEIHYCLHIILRFELEAELLAEEIQVKDIPKIWNQKMKDLFGFSPKNDKEGCLQDMHWSGGCFGYFPSYALGTIYSSQIYQAIKKAHPKVEEDIEKGDFSKIRNWLQHNIFNHGAKYLAEDAIKKACGEGLNPDKFLDYLNKKYSEIYNF